MSYKNERTLYIRSDGNPETGTGHIMRCLSIAEAANKQNITCVFITADNQMTPLIQDKGFCSICLDTAWNDLNQETEKLENLIRQRQIDRLLVDSYFVTETYLRRIKKLACTIYLDDLNAFQYPCDILINYNIYGEALNYPSRYSGTTLLLGPDYAPLREEFQQLKPRQVRDKMKSVLITTGGNDPLNTAGKLVCLAKEHPVLGGLEYRIIAGRFNVHAEELHSLANTYNGVTIYHNITQMSPFMLTCDAAVSSGGSTLYELCATGTPTVFFSCADNQLESAAGFGQSLMHYGGDVRGNTTACLQALISGLEQLYKNSDLRRSCSARIQRIVDGNGAARIASSIFGGCKPFELNE